MTEREAQLSETRILRRDGASDSAEQPSIIEHAADSFGAAGEVELVLKLARGGGFGSRNCSIDESVHSRWVEQLGPPAALRILCILVLSNALTPCAHCSRRTAHLHCYILLLLPVQRQHSDSVSLER